MLNFFKSEKHLKISIFLINYIRIISILMIILCLKAVSLCISCSFPWPFPLNVATEEDQVNETMVRLQLKIYFQAVYSVLMKGGTVYPCLQLGMAAGEGGTVFPLLHSGRSSFTVAPPRPQGHGGHTIEV